MALNFFKQSDIDNIDINCIPEEFENYFESLDETGKLEIAHSRPDLCAALGYCLPNAGKEAGPEKEVNSGIKEEGCETEEAHSGGKASEKFSGEDADLPETFSDKSLEEISNNLYEGKDLNEFLTDNAQPLEVLAIPENAGKCFLHHCDFTKHQLKYTAVRPTLGISVFVCGQCSRIYMKESNMDIYHAELKKRGISHKFYNLELTNRYLKSCMEDHVLGEDEVLYIPEVWIEENPLCPVHESELFEIKCVKTYKDRKAAFNGYLCPQCGKIMIRKALAADLDEKCAAAGVPSVKSEPFIRKEPLRKKAPGKEIRPDFIIEDGKKIPYQYDYAPDCYMLSAEDTVVVSDTYWCGINGHDFEEVPVLIHAAEYSGIKKAYLLLTGYCARCRKFYMDISDYEILYRNGCPDATLIRNFDDSAYRITSGDVFNLEKKHLEDLEENINSNICAIKSGDDYISPYAVADYDDGNLSYSKSESKNKYGKRLEELSAYTERPYKYRVDIASDDKSETYYIGVSEIELDGKIKVISAHSDFGHKLINYQTLKIVKDGTEYGIKLSREFKIDHAQLYGYTNLRTDEDLIFKKGITDPFLVRVLNIRKRQHNLTDIFVTIQENQNNIVNADFKSDIIVQGCAGSGKTMVLLHRLSSLTYRIRNFDFARYAMILTPNNRFNLHIKGLAEGLQIGSIARISVEQYYLDMLMEYDPAFKPDTGISTETAVPEIFVDYIYSDKFIDDFSHAYDKVLAKRNVLAEDISLLSDTMKKQRPKIDLNNNPGAFLQMKFSLDGMKDLIGQRDSAVKEAEAERLRVISGKQHLEEKIAKARADFSETVKEKLNEANRKIKTYLETRQDHITALEESLRKQAQEYYITKNSVILVGKKDRLARIEEQIRIPERGLKTQDIKRMPKKRFCCSLRRIKLKKTLFYG